MRHIKELVRLLAIFGLLLTATSARAAQLEIYKGGAVMSPRIHRVYWGSWAQTAINAQEAYLNTLVAYMSNDRSPAGTEPTMRQYGVWGAALGTLVPAQAITQAQLCQQGYCTNGVLDRPGLERKITELRNASKLPATSSPDLVLVMTQGLSTVDCGFHWFTSAVGAYAFVPSDVCGPELQNASSHEIFEASVDYNPNAPGWLDAGGAEIADNCAPIRGFRFPDGTVGDIAQIWDNNLSTCSIFTAEEDLPLTQAIRPDQATFDVTSRVRDQLWTTTGNGSTWTASTQLAVSGVVDGPSSVNWFNGGKRSVFFRAVDGSYQHLFFNGSAWSQQSLGGVFVGQPSAVVWFTSIRLGTTQVNVFGRGTDGLLYSFWSTDGVSWSFGSLGKPANAVLLTPPTASPLGALNSFVVNFVGSDGHFYSKTWNGTSWSAFTDRSSAGDVFLGNEAALGSSSVTYQRGIANNLLMLTSTGTRDLGGIIFGTPSAVMFPGCAPQAYVRGSGTTSGTLWASFSGDCGANNQWTQVDETLISTAPVAVIFASNHLNVFVRDAISGLIGLKQYDGVSWQAMGFLPQSVD